MTNYNERLDELEEQFLADYRSWLEGPWDYSGLNPKQKFHQALTSLIKELVAEAKPKRKTLAELNGGWRADIAQGFNECLDAYEQNLLKALEEV